MRICCIVLLFLSFCGALVAQVRPLPEQLQRAARKEGLRLVYSPGTVSDTLVDLSTLSNEIGAGGESLLDVLTRTYGLRYEIIGQQAVIAKRRPVTFPVGGYIEDAITGERLVGATVLLTGKARGAVSNGYGHFAIAELQTGDQLVFRYVGYPTDTLRISSYVDDEVVIRLKPSLSLGVVEVLASSVPELPKLTTSIDAQPAAVLDKAELLTGDRDINAFLGLLPGVQSAPGGFGGYSVRGADPNQNLVLLDDATLYLPSHAIGYISSVPGAAVRSIQLHRNGGPARYGDRVGAVLDIRLKEGTRAKHMGQISAGTTDVNVSAEGPLAKGSYFVSARQGLTDVWLKALRGLYANGAESFPDVSFNFGEVATKVNYPISPTQRIYASFFYGRDRYSDASESVVRNEGLLSRYNDEAERRWANSIGSFRHAMSLGSRWFVNTTFTLSEFNYSARDYLRLTERPADESPAYTFSDDIFRSNLLDLGLRQDYEFAWRPDLNISFGVDATSHRFRVGTQSLNGIRQPTLDSSRIDENSLDPSQLPQLRSSDVSTYASIRYQPNARWQVDVGLRLASQLAHRRRTYVALLPRVNVRHRLSQAFGLNLEFGESRQFIHQISTRNPGLPRDLWSPTVGPLRPQGARYASLGATYVTDGIFSGSATVYTQQLENLSRFDGVFEGEGLGNWTQNVRKGSGSAIGLELEGSLQLGKTDVVANATLANATRTFEDELGDELVKERYRLDRRGAFTITARQPLGERWNVSATWRLGSSLPVRLPTPNTSGPTLPTNGVPLTRPFLYNGTTTELPTFHSLDLGAMHRFTSGNSEYRLTFGIQNAYLNRNPLFLSLQTLPEAEQGSPRYQVTAVTLLRCLPFARLTVQL